MAFEGSCHCGKVAFSIDDELPAKAVLCNCSHCRAKGFLVAYYPGAKFTLLRGEEDLKSYRFNTHVIEHRFCGICGVEPFAQANAPDGTPVKAINLRSVPSLNLDTLELDFVDGANLLTGARAAAEASLG
jgi:hypothetical protein